MVFTSAPSSSQDTSRGEGHVCAHSTGQAAETQVEPFPRSNAPASEQGLWTRALHPSNPPPLRRGPRQGPPGAVRPPRGRLSPALSLCLLGDEHPRAHQLQEERHVLGRGGEALPQGPGDCPLRRGPPVEGPRRRPLPAPQTLPRGPDTPPPTPGSWALLPTPVPPAQQERRDEDKQLTGGPPRSPPPAQPWPDQLGSACRGHQPSLGGGQGTVGGPRLLFAVMHERIGCVM